MALVVTLSLIVLVAITAVAFFSRATANRTVEVSRSNQVLAAQLASTAEDYVAAQFLGEIVANSIGNSTSGISIYQPTEPKFAVPQRAVPASAPFNASDFMNLIRLSGNATLNGIGEPNASIHNTSTPSRNGRFISSARWNAPLLLGGSGFTSNADLPSWIYVNKDGSASATPGTNAIGRFAYVAYNIGGLLDANVAGHPANVTGNDLVAIKGTLAGADLTRIPGVTSPDTFTAWRNGSSVTTPAGYLADIADFSQSGFLRPPPGNQIFTGRQDLIRLAQNGNIGISPAALPYLTAFSRTTDGPSFTPDPARPKVQSVLPGVKTELPAFGKDDLFNPSLIAIRVQTEFTRDDGTQAEVGEPLLKKKFPLDRLSLLEAATGAVNEGDQIHKYFGLTRSSATDPWTYNHGQADRILQLAEVAALPAASAREPDFFELLQACLPVGSLGKSVGESLAWGNGVGWIGTDPHDDVPRDAFSKYQILQIGANLVDQWDADSYPTRIHLTDANYVSFPDVYTFSGIENLPYLARVFVRIFLDMGPDPDNLGGPPLEFMNYFFQPEVWNPHQGAASLPSEPTQFRFVVDGATRVRTPSGYRPRTTYTKDANSGIRFSGAVALREPTVLDRLGSSLRPQDNKTPTVGSSAGNPFVGVFIDKIPAPFPDGTDCGIGVDPKLSFELQYNRDGQWITYIGMRWKISGEYEPPRVVNGFNGPNGSYEPQVHRRFALRSDPRVERFGFRYGAGKWQHLPRDASGQTLRPAHTDSSPTAWLTDSDTRLTLYPGWSVSSAVESPGWGYDFHFGLLTGNKPQVHSSGRRTSYLDADGVSRLGDAAFSDGDIGEPMTTGNLDSRPVILNRPFRSVGEMGYAGRDLPWKTLDLFTDKSADGALLDAFCLNESDAGVIVAGKVDLNTAPAPVLESLLVGAEKKTGSEVTSAQATALAPAIRSALTASGGNNTLTNIAELGKKITSNAAVASALGTNADAAIKTQREVLTRALGDVGQVRTWNLLADIVAQVGRFPAPTALAAGDFVVEGEQRMWSSIAIDRPTATVVNSQTENIHE
jgi:hypothetical protein